jgi:serine protease AprX
VNSHDDGGGKSVTYAQGFSWGRQRVGSALGALVVALAASLAMPSPVAPDQDPALGRLVRVIVRQTSQATTGPARAVERLGGNVGRPLAIIGGFAAEVPSGALGAIRQQPGVVSVTPDSKLHMAGDGWRADDDPASLFTVAKEIGAHDAWGKSDSLGRKVTGKGVTVALIDTGVVPVGGLTGPGKVINGPDLSFESQSDDLRHLDTFGHGTHMAGIIAGRDTAVQAGNEKDDDHFVGIAPDAALLNVKVASSDGATDVSQVIAAIDWVVQHRHDNGMNVRVLNLSFGTDSVQSYVLDPLAYAAEVAWRKGIVVVTAAGNAGLASTTLTNPAIDPYLIAVGASDHKGTDKTDDDVVASFSSAGSLLTRRPDLVAPGRSIVSLRNPGSHIDQTHPEGLVAGESTQRFFRGSGTSQAAAVVSGAAALLLQQRPALTPDQVKRLLTKSADSLKGNSVAQGAGLIDLKGAIESSTPSFVQSYPTATGTGSLELARGTSHVADPEDGTELIGEQDIFGQAWDGRSWSQAAWEGRSWSGGTWNGRSWSGEDWSGTSWSGRSWSGRSWSGTNWTGRSWSGRSWSDNVWEGRSWSGRSWSDQSWSGRSWSGLASGRSWSTSDWGS